MPPKVRALLFDIQHAALGVQSFVDGRTINDLNNDLMLRSAVERQFEIMGEAMTRLRNESPQTCEKISEYPRVINFRNVLIQEKVPILLREVAELVK